MSLPFPCHCKIYYHSSSNRSTILARNMYPNKAASAQSLSLLVGLEDLFYFPLIRIEKIKDLALLIHFGKPQKSTSSSSHNQSSLRFSLPPPIDYQLCGDCFRMDPNNMLLVVRPLINILKPTLITIKDFVCQVLVRVYAEPVNVDHSLHSLFLQFHVEESVILPTQQYHHIQNEQDFIQVSPYSWIDLGWVFNNPNPKMISIQARTIEDLLAPLLSTIYIMSYHLITLMCFSLWTQRPQKLLC